MSRGFESVERRAQEEVAEVKSALKRLSSRQRIPLLHWVCHYVTDDGAIRATAVDKPRRRITLDGVEYWLVRVPNKRA